MPIVDVELGEGRYKGPRPPVSVVILTFNEESNIADCIRSCAWSDDIHVLDSESTDRTAEIARSMGVAVHVHPFKSFGDQHDWAIDNIPCKHPWHFHLDADERFAPGIVQEMASILGETGAASPHACYNVPSKTIFMARWLKRGGRYPAYQVRLFKRGLCRFVDYGHGQLEVVQGTTGTLAHPFMHYSFSKGMVEWLNKHNGYSSLEAAEALEVHERPRFSGLWSNNAGTRELAFQHFSRFLRPRTFWRFMYNYLVRGGILDGLPGLDYCLMTSMYEYWIALKVKEARQHWTRDTNALVVTMTQTSEARAQAHARHEGSKAAAPATGGTTA